MTTEERLEALAGMAGHVVVSAEALSTESRNALWRVRLDGGTAGAILKQYDPATDPHAANRFRREEKVLTLLSGCTPPVAPAPLGGFIGPSGPAMLLMEDAGPRSLADELLAADNAPSLWREAVGFVGLLHAAMAKRRQPLYRTAMSIDLDRINLGVLKRRFQIAGRRLDGSEPSRSVVAEFGAVIAPLISAPKAMIHNSLSPLNIIRGPKGWRAIDWETLTLASPLWDWAEFLRAPYSPLSFEECEAIAVTATDQPASLFHRAVLSRSLDSLATVALRRRTFEEHGNRERTLEYARRCQCYRDGILECIRRLAPPAALSQWLCARIGSGD